jgi:hypothetical protein
VAAKKNAKADLDPNTPLVTEEEVRAVYPCPPTKDLNPYIETAHLIVCENLNDGSNSDARLKQIELYLSAHFACVSDGGQIQSHKVGDATDTYAVSKDSGLGSTQYGQVAIGIDNSGALAELVNPAKKARFILTGPPTSWRRPPWPQD